MTGTQIFLALISYSLGAIPSGYIIVKRFYGMDIRQYGSGNPGTANVYRTCGKKAGFATFIFDTFKGYVPTAIAVHQGYSLEFTMFVGILAVIGHVWTVFLNFRGGKGVATSAGVFAALLPVPTLWATVAFLIGVGVSGHISIGSMLAAIVVPVVSFSIGAPSILSFGTSLLCALILVRHISNLKRIWMGREHHIRGAK